MGEASQTPAWETVPTGDDSLSTQGGFQKPLVDKRAAKALYMRKWRKKNHDKIRSYEKHYYHSNRSDRKTKMRSASLKRLYGITIEEFNEVLASQDHHCANKNCSNTEIGNGWVWDHDHSTGKSRGILCSNCNLVLGLVGDSTDKLNGLVDYLNGVY